MTVSMCHGKLNGKVKDVGINYCCCMRYNFFDHKQASMCDRYKGRPCENKGFAPSRKQKSTRSKFPHDAYITSK